MGDYRGISSVNGRQDETLEIGNTEVTGDLDSDFNGMIRQWKLNLNGSKKMGEIDLQTQHRTTSNLL